MKNTNPFFYLYQMWIGRCELLDNSQRSGIREISIINNMPVETCSVLQKEFRCYENWEHVLTLKMLTNLKKFQTGKRTDWGNRLLMQKD